MILPSKFIRNTLLVLPLVLTSVGCGVDDRKANHAAKAKQLFEQGNYEKARLEYKNVVYIDPKDKDGHFGLAETHEKLGDFRVALGEYQNVLKLDENNLQAKARMAYIYASHGGMKQGEELALEVLEAEPDNSDSLLVMAMIAAQKGDSLQAIAGATQALESDPLSISANIVLSTLYLQAKQFDDAEGVLNQRLTAGNTSTDDEKDLNLQLAKTLMVANKFEQAILPVNKVITLEPSSLEYRVLLSGLYLKLDDKAQAEDTLRTAIKDIPEEAAPKLVLVDFINKNNGKEEAETLLKNYVATENSKEMSHALAEFYQKTGENEKAVDTLQKIIEADETSVEGIDAMNKLAALYAVDSKPDEAMILLEKVLDDNPKDERALLLRGKIRLLKGDTVKAVLDFRSLLKQQPNSVDVRRLLARAHVASGDLELARNNLQKAVSVDERHLLSKFELAELEIKLRDFDSAKRTIESLLAIDATNVKALNMLLTVQVALKDDDGAIKTAKLVQDTIPESGLGYFLEGRLLRESHQITESNERLLAALKKQPGAVEPLVLLINNYVQLKNFSSAHDILNTRISQSKDNFFARNLKGEVFLAEGNPKEASKELNRAISLKDDWWVPRRNLSAAMRQLGDMKGAIHSLEKAVEISKGSERLLLDLAVMYGQEGERTKAVSTYRKMLEINPSSISVKNNLAMILVDDQSTQDEKKEALSLVESFSSLQDAPLLDTLAWVAYKNGNADEGIRILKGISLENPKFGELFYHLGVMQNAVGDTSGAITNLKASLLAEIGFPDKDIARKLLAEIEG